MNLLTPIPLATIATVAAIVGGLVVTAYILKMRRRRFEVPFSNLWHRVLKEKEATSLWRHLKRFLSLLLLLFILGILLFASLEPELGGRDADARSVVIIIDASASMKTIDEGPDGTLSRMQAAKNEAMELLDGMSGGDAVMLMRMDGRSTPLSRFQSDVPKLKRVVESIEAGDTPADLRKALSAAADALRQRQAPLLIIIGDGAYDEEQLAAVSWEESKAQLNLSQVDLAGIDVRYQPVGLAKDNVGIIGFNVRRYISNKLNYEAYIELQNFSEKAATRRLVLYNGDSEIDVQEIHLGPGERSAKIYKDLGGGDDSVLRASIETLTEAEGDAFPLDDEAWALIPKTARQKILLVSEDNLYLEGALLVMDNLDIDKITPSEYTRMFKADEFGNYDAVVYHEFTPEALLPSPTHAMFFNPSGPSSPFKVLGKLERGRITSISQSHPIMRWVELGDTNFDKLSTFEVDRSQAEVPLAQSIRSSVAAAKKDGRRKIAAFGFGLKGTDLMLRTSFVLIMVNTMDWFAGSDSDLLTTYQTGHRARVPLDGTYGVSEVEVQTPSGRTIRAPLSEAHATFYADEVGVHKLVVSHEGEEVASIMLAANLSTPSESDIEPSADLLLGGTKLLRPKPSRPSHRQSLWLYLALMVLLLLIVEWYTFNRRITV